ncbi:MAG TPA: NAD-dependent epimerase/dehydratase family protein [Anaerolineae bacterium]|nr:NAD-dependent epimerase/dehydratase family protein [Anaerolineae bacterium]HQH37278.1 NAD-dependent epimerase/dehydratase family protein [Anaerolineae bacterium]
MDNKPVILVTGGAGYIGSQLIRDLVLDPRFNGAIVRIYDSLRHKNFNALMDLPVAGRYEFVEGDILDRLNLQRAMQDVTAVIHLAAIVTTPLSFDHPEWTEQINHWGTAAVVDCMLRAGITRMLYTSSASVYGPGGPFKETDPCHPVGPYATAKRKAEDEVRQAEERGLQATIVRLGTTFGSAPAMRFDAAVNRFAYLTGVRRPMVIHGSGGQVCPFIHIRDASRVLRMALADPAFIGATVNAATEHLSLNDIAAAVQHLAPEATTRYTDQDILAEISFDVDVSKLTGMGFTPQVSLEEGLREVLERWKGF